MLQMVVPWGWYLFITLVVILFLLIVVWKKVRIF